MSEDKNPYFVSGVEVSKNEYDAYIRLTSRKRSKYNAIKCSEDGFTFDSKAEMRRYLDLRFLVQAGQIVDLKVHPKFTLLDDFVYQGKRVKGITYEADFSYFEEGKLIVEDVKGVQTKDFKLKYKMFMSRYPDCEIRLIT